MYEKQYYIIRKKVVFIIIDGMADLPEEKTPLSEAFTPNLDSLASNGVTGTLNLLPKTIPVWSHFADVSLLGFNPKRYYLKRGPLEAIAAGIPLEGDFLAIRCNFATTDENGKVIDRRAGRKEYGLNEIVRTINSSVNLGIPYVFLRTYGHRAVLVLKAKLSDKVSENDPLETGKAPKPIKPLVKSKRAKLTARILNDFINKAHSLMEFHPKNLERMNLGYLPANYIIMREPGNKVQPLPDFKKRWKIEKAVCISEPGVTKAVCMLAGFDAVTIKPKGFKEDLEEIFSQIFDLLPEYNFILAHIKGPDEPGHDGNFEKKKEMIEEIDKRLEEFLDFEGILVLTADHITSWKTKKHEHGPVPVLVYGRGRDRVKKFDELSVKKGRLKKYTGGKLWKYIFKR